MCGNWGKELVGKKVRERKGRAEERKKRRKEEGKEREGIKEVGDENERFGEVSCIY